MTAPWQATASNPRLIVNIWKLQRDPRVWADPLEFRPERFLTSHKDFDVRGRHFELLPFGGGRRICPGITFALQLTAHALASLLHGFGIETVSDEAVDMTGSLGATNIKSTPLEVLLTPRLVPGAYA
ncbi:Flavonoid-6-hydroxylase [Orobanche hederae]